MKERIFAADANGRERFGPEVANFENERNLAGEGDPPSGEVAMITSGRGRVRPRRAAERQNDV